MPGVEAGSDSVELEMRLGRQLDPYAVMRADRSTGDDDAHDPSLADQAPLLVAVQDSLHQAGLEVFKLIAGVAEAGHLDDGVGAEVQPRAARQAEEVEATGGDVLTQLPRCDVEASISQLVVELSMNEMDLPQVRPGRVGSARTRERCCTVTPACASLSTPTPATSSMLLSFGLLNLCTPLRLTATTSPAYLCRYTRIS